MCERVTECHDQVISTQFCTLRINRRFKKMSVRYMSENKWKFNLLVFSVLVSCKVSWCIAGLLTLLFYLSLRGWKVCFVIFKTIGRDFRFIVCVIKAKIQVGRIIKSGELVPDLFDRTVHERPDATAFLFEDTSWTFREFQVYVNRVANALLDEGFRPGSVIAIFAESRPEYIGLWLGAVRAGLIPSLVNFNLRSDSLAHCIEAANAVAIIFGSEVADAIVDIQPRLVSCRYYYTGGPNGGKVDRSINLDAIVEECSSEWTPMKFDTKFNDIMMYIYTSGTTGLPKPAIVPHSKFYLAALVPHLVYKLTADDVVYTSLPLYHSGGGMMGVGQALMFGSCVAIRKKFSATHFWDDCIKYKATVIQYIGEICRYLLARPPSDSDKAHNVRLAFGNGLRPGIWTRFQSRFNIKIIGEFYGATESNANLINTDNTVGAVGFIMPLLSLFYRIRIVRVNPDTGELIRDPSTGLCLSCRPGEAGQLVGKIIRNDAMGGFYGYLNKKETEKKIAHNVLTPGDSVFLTGDILVTDDLGYVYFRDRTGDTFRWRGENVSTAEVESAISAALGHVTCAVYGVEIPNVEGRAGMAAIDLKGSQFDEKRLQEEVSRRLPPYARPLFLRLTDDIDITGTFKLRKMKLLQDGFDPTATKDNLFYYDFKENSYLPLTDSVFDEIMNGQMRF